MDTEISATPVQQLNMELNGNAFYMKRDDLIPYSFGGNKVRKGILFFEKIMAGGHDTVVTYGSSSSNHCRVIANMARARNIPCLIIAPKEAGQETCNSRLIRLLGAGVIHCSVDDVKATIDCSMESLTQEGRKPYFIPGGGHGMPGTEAYVLAYEEIRDQEKSSGRYFDLIFLTSGTGSTQAGLVCGQLKFGDSRKIIGISSARKNPYGRQIVEDSIREYFQDKVPQSEISQSQISQALHFIDDYVLEGYGSHNGQVLHTINEIYALEGIPLDPTYTGKGFWGMTQYIEKHRITGKNVLFIHTGGTPLFFDAMETLEYEKAH